MRKSLELNIVFLLGIAAFIALIAYLHRTERQLAEHKNLIAQQDERLIALEAERAERLKLKGKIKTALALGWQATKELICRNAGTTE